MSVYVYIDSAGAELRREVKGRGRTKAGAFQTNSDSDEWFVVVLDGESLPEANTEAPGAIPVSKEEAPKPEYIYLDKDGKELRREPKGRGRSKKGAEEREPGKWYVVEGYIPPTPKYQSFAPKKDVESEVEELEEKVEVGGRKFKHSPIQLTAEEMISCCMPVGKIITDNGITTINCPFIKGVCGLPGICFNSVFHRVVIDRNEKTIAFLVLPGKTETVFTNALRD